MADDPVPYPQPHVHRQVAESFGVDAERYDRARPRYPAALVDRVIAGSPGTDVLDVGCGTGIEARQFQTAGCAVVGVDPDERMAAFACRSGIEVEVARFEDWDAAGRTFDMVIAGTAWHWVDPVVGAAKAAQVLRPSGRLAPFHHVFQLPAVVAEAIGEAYGRVVPSADLDLRALLLRSALDTYQPLFAEITEGMRVAGWFGEPEQWRFDWERTYRRDDWLDQLPTFGGLTRLTADQLREIQATTGAAIDRLGGSVTVHYSTIVVTAVRTADPT